MSGLPVLRTEIDGRPATVEDVCSAMLSAYGHFTAMQVRGGRTRGLDFHLARLDAATRELFDAGLEGDRVRDLIRHALGDDIDDASVRVNVFRTEPDPEPDSDPASHREPGPGPAAGIRIMVTVRPPAFMPGAPQSLKTVGYQRPVAHIKHVGGFGQAYYRRLAQRDGFDEALLVAPDGSVAEGAITNIGFIDGGTVVWPDAPALLGITMQLLDRELSRADVPCLRRTVRVADVSGFDGAFVTNSRGVAPVARVDDIVLPADVERVAKIMRVYASAPWDPI